MHKKKEGRPGRVHSNEISCREERMAPWTASPLVLTAAWNESRDTGSVIPTCQEGPPWRREGSGFRGRGSEAGQWVHSWALPFKPQLSRHALCHLMRSVSTTPCAVSLICQPARPSLLHSCALSFTKTLLKTPLFCEACLRSPLQDCPLTGSLAIRQSRARWHE